jgi:truncated hemoglobin YjbI
MKIETIDKIIRSFYKKAMSDILIGYQFRVIDDFEEHIPKIVSFWELQINKKITNKSHLPFNILKKHAPLKLNTGEVFRWVVLFENTLNEFIQNNLITEEDKVRWMKLVEFFKERLLKSLS